MKEFVKTTGCYRVAVYKPFDPLIVPVNPGHNCCLYCAQCECNPPLCRPVSDEDNEDLQAALTELSLGKRNHLTSGTIGAVSLNCFSPELVDDIVSNCHKLFSIQDIVGSNLPVYSIAHSLKIQEVIQEIFEDIPNLDCALKFFFTVSKLS